MVDWTRIIDRSGNGAASDSGNICSGEWIKWSEFGLNWI